MRAPDASGQPAYSCGEDSTALEEECAAEWTIDGRTVVGGFNAGNGCSDVGKTVNATVRGDTAYSRSLALPILLILLGLPIVIILAAGARKRRSS